VSLPKTLTWKLAAELKRTTEKFKKLSARLKRLSENKRASIELGDERGEEIMAPSVLAQMGEQIDDTARKASRAASAVADALEDGVGTARRTALHGARVATEFLDDTKKRVRRHPIETVVVTFVAGIAAGAVIGLIMRRGQL
jgi:ElaB/YqjD/DUF883 family membrane-anchored ribosome-binding protein